jgi:hypothetical protein
MGTTLRGAGCRYWYAAKNRCAGYAETKVLCALLCLSITLCLCVSILHVVSIVQIFKHCALHATQSSVSKIPSVGRFMSDDMQHKM